MLDSLDISNRKALIFDGGPIYHEFIPDACVKEPWNAYSSLVFFIPVIFWIWRLKGEYNENLIIVAILPLLFLNGLGSTLYHAFRTNPFYLYLDFMPASLMNLILSIYFWTKIVRKWYVGLLIVLGCYAFGGFSIFALVEWFNAEEMSPNISYFFVGASFLIPILIILVRTKGYKLSLVIASFVFLGLALLCRAADYPSPNLFPEFLPQGTHFMWHIFSAMAVFTMGYYVYHINKIDLSNQ